MLSTSAAAAADAPMMTTTDHSHNNRNNNKRSNNNLDCQSLQAGLKRVRLSCSPGELRLQRDLRFLPTLNWQPDEQQALVDEGNNKDTATKPSFLLDSNPRWHFRGPIAGALLEAELQLLDPLRLLLCFHVPHQGISRLWIQIPRMYPHRPPVIARLENMGMDQIIIAEEDPSSATVVSLEQRLLLQQQQQAKGQDTSSTGATTSATSSSTAMETTLQGSLVTVIYKEWSPVRHLGDLVMFLLHLGVEQPPSRRQQAHPSSPRSSLLTRASSFASSSMTNTTTTSLTAPLTGTSSSSSSTSSSSSSFTCSRTAASLEASSTSTSGALTRRMRHSYPSLLFQDEHKMDDFTMANNHHDAQATPILFAPNRFDVGYGKYQEPLASSPSSSSAWVASAATTTDPNDAMEF